MATAKMQMTFKGGRYITRGWTRAAWMKRQRSKLERRKIKHVIMKTWRSVYYAEDFEDADYNISKTVTKYVF